MKISEVHRFIEDIVTALYKYKDIIIWTDYRDRVWASFWKSDSKSDGFGIQFIKESKDNYGEIHFGKFFEGNLDVSEGYTGIILDSSFKSDTEEAQRIANIIHSYTIENATTEGEQQMTKKQEALERLQRAGIADENGELAKEYRTEEPERNEDNEPEPTALACSDFPTLEEIDELDRIGLAGVMKKRERQERWDAIWFWVKVLLISICGGVVGTVLYRWIMG